MSVAVEAAPRPYRLAAWAALLSTLAMLVGWHWDISWHRSIGRDTAWTLPHLSIYASLIIAFAYNAIVVLTQTFGAGRGLPGVTVFGFRALSASFVTLWSTLLMGTAIVFDFWWHDVYGLDIGVFSPPHYMLSFGIAMMYLGQFGVVVTLQNQLGDTRGRGLRLVALAVFGLFIGHQILIDASFGAQSVKSVAFVVSGALFLPFSLALPSHLFDVKLPATRCCLFYMAVLIVLMQVFQLFPATPGFGPVYQDVPNFLPPLFPLLIVIPALAVELLLARVKRRGLMFWLGLGAVFVAVSTAANHLYAAIITGPLGQNRFFGGMYPPSAFDPDFRGSTPLEASPAHLALVALSVVLAAGSARIGAATGQFLKGLRR